MHLEGSFCKVNNRAMTSREKKPEGCILSPEATTPARPSTKGDFDAMARRRFQNAKPRRSGCWWYLLYWQDVFSDGERTRQRKRVKLAPAELPEREARKMAAEFLRPMNQGLAPIGSDKRSFLS
jgi:hypothetical protein